MSEQESVTVERQVAAKVLVDRQAKQGRLVYQVVAPTSHHLDLIRARINFELGATGDRAFWPVSTARFSLSLAGDIQIAFSFLDSTLLDGWSVDGVLLHPSGRPYDEVERVILSNLRGRDGWMLVDSGTSR